MKCKICNLRKPRRYCPGVLGDICSICCGTEREVTVNCPLDCPHLIAAHQYEKVAAVDPEHVPNADIEVTDAFLRRNQNLVGFTGFTLKAALAQTPEAVDSDVREALDALTRTYRTMAKGLYYDSWPTNPYALRIVTHMRQALEEFGKDAQAQGASVRDSDYLMSLIMFQRLALTYNNGRVKGRSFIGYLNVQFDEAHPEAIEKEQPRLIEL